MFLVDTNVWVEVLLGQEKAKEASDFLKRTPASELSLTDFTLYSIGIILAKLGRDDAYRKFLGDVLTENDVRIIRLTPSDLAEVPTVVRRFHVDFDDAYQYVAAGRFNAALVSFDSDFDKTDLKRLAPSQAV
jgi:predicted nucleic acid-binding protein